jgi:hypothetical protein
MQQNVISSLSALAQASRQIEAVQPADALFSKSM